MEHLFADPDKLKELLQDRHICLFLDFDGTLTPIAPRPEDAVLAAGVRELLKSLAQSGECQIAIVSGRGLDELKKLVAVENITYVGNHGFDMEGPDFSFEYPVPIEYVRALRNIADALRKYCIPISGVIVQDKAFSVSLHYRLAGTESLATIKEIVAKTVLPYTQRGEVAVHGGKMVFEIRPPLDWHKGKAVLWLLEHRPPAAKNVPSLPICIGDDITDEDAFVSLKDKGLTIVVGRPEKSAAQYYLNDTAEVAQFLRQVVCYIKE